MIFKFSHFILKVLSKGVKFGKLRIFFFSLYFLWTNVSIFEIDVKAHVQRIS